MPPASAAPKTKKRVHFDGGKDKKNMKQRRMSEVFGAKSAAHLAQPKVRHRHRHPYTPHAAPIAF